MKRTHKGFTLVELLIVVAVIGVLATMMMMSSSDAVDSASANSILANLNSMKTAVYQMYMEDSNMAAKTQSEQIISFKETKETLAKYLGKLAATEAIGIDITAGTGKYDLIGKGASWFVVYQLDASDSAGVRAKLKAKGNDVELYAAASPSTGENDCGFTNDTTSDAYNKLESTAQYFVALRVFGE